LSASTCAGGCGGARNESAMAASASDNLRLGSVFAKLIVGLVTA
jgi:hypothetical protein